MEKPKFLMSCLLLPFVMAQNQKLGLPRGLWITTGAPLDCWRDPVFLGLGFHRLLALVFHHKRKYITSNDHMAINQTQNRIPKDPSFMQLIYSFASWFASLSPAVTDLPCPWSQCWKPPSHPPGSGPLATYWSLSCNLPGTNFSS